MGINHEWLTEKPESPSFGGDKDGKETTRIYQINKSLTSNLSSILPASGEYDSADGYFIDYRVSSKIAYDEVSLHYVSNPDMPGGSLTAVNLQVKYDLNINIIDKMLEDHPNYLTKWNYNLYQSFKSETGKARNIDSDYPLTTAPSWVAIAKDLSNSDGITYIWSKTTPSDFKDKDSEYFWKLHTKMIKPGAEAYIIAQAVITEKKYFKLRKESEAFLIPGCGLRDPAQRFSWPASGADKKWLAYPLGIANDGKFFIATNEYHYADKWDTDLYGAI